MKRTPAQQSLKNLKIKRAQYAAGGYGYSKKPNRPANPVAQDGVVDMIVSYNTSNNQLRYHVITLDVLKFGVFSFVETLGPALLNLV